MKLDPQAQGSIAVPKIKKEGLKGFYRNVVREMKHVNWPTMYEANRLTGVVLAVCIIAASILFVLSILFDSLHSFILKGG
jgi:preprotein translocase SecE subunit